MARFPYPERPIIYLALCHCIIALVLIVGYSHEDDIVCNEAIANRSMNFLTEKTIKQVSKGFVFSLHYIT